MENKDLSKVELDNYEIVGEVESSFDISKYKGEKVKIAKVEAHEHMDNGMYLRVTTEPLDTLEFDGEEKPIYASRNFGLIKKVNEETLKPTIAWAKNGNLAKFLKLNKANNFKDLVGKEVIVTIDQRKDGKQYLTFA